MTADTREPLPVLFYERPRCPRCESVRLRVRRTIDQGDDSRLQYVQCKRCKTNFKVVSE